MDGPLGAVLGAGIWVGLGVVSLTVPGLDTAMRAILAIVTWGIALGFALELFSIWD